MTARSPQMVLAFATLVATSLVLAFAGGVAAEPSEWSYSGDFRLRYENTNNQQPGPAADSRNREVVRFRAGLMKEINERTSFGVRLATGSSNDPNTSDVTLGSFVNDLEVSLDRAYIEWHESGLTLTGGKFANPFRVTDLVWDGDVNPQGAAASYAFTGSEQIKGKAGGLFYIVDENEHTTTPDSDMRGGQIELTSKLGKRSSLTVAGGYYDYKISSLRNADAGDTRSNNLKPGGLNYVSDFDLLDIVATVDLPGFNERYPIRVVGDFVKNLGAEVDADQGFGVDVFMGRASKPKDARVRYGYAQAETDAVLAAFSHDNTTIATNYLQHTLTVEYVPLEKTTLGITWYLHRLDVVPAGVSESDDWVSRLRFDAMVSF